MNLFNNLIKYINIIINWFYKPVSNYIPAITFRYGFTGFANTCFDIFLYFIFYNFILQKEIVELYIIAISPHIAAFVFVFPITFTSGFLLAKYITFTQSNLRGRKQLFRYGLTVAGSIILHYFLLKFFVEIIGFWPTIAKTVTVSFVIIYSYFAQKYFSFKVVKKIVKII